MRETIDFDRCVWDEQYRSRIKQALNYPRRAVIASANENVRGRVGRPDRRAPAVPE